MKTLRVPKLKINGFMITLVTFSLSFETVYAAGSKKMFSLNNTDFVVLISFLIFVGILIYFKVPSIVAAFLDKRSNDIHSEIEKAGKILEEAKKSSLRLKLIILKQLKPLKICSKVRKIAQ